MVSKVVKQERLMDINVHSADGDVAMSQYVLENVINMTFVQNKSLPDLITVLYSFLTHEQKQELITHLNNNK